MALDDFRVGNENRKFVALGDEVGIRIGIDDSTGTLIDFTNFGVEIKNYDSDDRAEVNAANHALIVGVRGDVGYNSIDDVRQFGIYGWDGNNWQKIGETSNALDVNVASGTVTVTGTVAATQSGTWNIGTVTTLTGITNPVAVTGTFWQTTQPVSGTVAISSGTITETNLTSLAKAEDSAWSTGDKGIPTMAVAQSQDYDVDFPSDENDYTPLSTDAGGWLRTKSQPVVVLDYCTATSGYSVLGDDTINLTTASNHLAGTASLSFDKTNGSDNTKIAGIQRTLSTGSINFFKLIGILGYLHTMVYLSDTSDCDYFFIRLGTDNANYNEWRIDISDSWTAGVWNTIQISLADANYAGFTGAGWNASAVTYLAYGVAFDAETDALAGILVDRVLFIGGQVTSTDITASITSDINSANVNLLKVGNKVVNTNTGNSGTGTQRVVLASDQPTVKTIINGGDGALSDTTITLTNSATAYEFPASAPAVPYLLIAHNGSDTDMYIRFSTGTTTGWLLATGGSLNIDMGASETLFGYCASAGKILNYSTRGNY